MFFWNSLAFSMIQRMLAIWSLVLLPFLKPAWTSGSSWFMYCCLMLSRWVYGFSSSHIWLWESDHKKVRALKNWCLWTLVNKGSWESLCKEIQPVHPIGNQSWIFIGRTDVDAETPILWLPDAKSWLIWKNPDAGKDWRQEEKGMTKDKIVGWHHQLDEHELG